MMRGEPVSSLKGVYDIERLAGKVRMEVQNARDLNSRLKASAKKLPEIKS